MPTKTGGSHALAAFVSIILGSMISNFLAAHAGLMTGLSRAVGSFVTSLLGVSVPWRATGMAVIASGLAFVWGVAYHFSQLEESTTDELNRPDRQQTREPSEEAVPESLREAIPEYSFRTPSAVRTTDRAVRATVDWELSVVKTALDGLHDSLYDDGARDDAERVTQLRHDLTTVQRQLDTESTGDETHEAVATAEEGVQKELRECDTDLVESLENLVETVTQSGAVSESERNSHFDRIEQQIEDVERVLSKRQNVLDRVR